MLRSARVVLGSMAAAGCSHNPAPAALLPICLRAEAADHTSGVQELTFDTEGNLTLWVELDTTGKELARTTLTWSASGIVVARTGGSFPFEQLGTFGDHGELVDFTSDGQHAHFVWSGTFAAVVTPPASRFAFEQFYHVIVDEPVLPLDSAARGVWARMRAFTFTGTVAIHDDGKAAAADVHATYDRGHQTELAIGGPRPRTYSTTWSSDLPVSQRTADSTRTFTFARGRLARIDADVSFTYDDAGLLTHVHTAPAIDVEIERCAR